MKKTSLILLMVFLVAVSFLAGLFTGRNLNRSPIRVSQNNFTTPSVSGTTANGTGTSDSDLNAPPSDQLININTASALELATLPGIGDVIAQRIVDYRTEHGAFKTVGELTEVEGIGEKRLETLLDIITTGG